MPQSLERGIDDYDNMCIIQVVWITGTLSFTAQLAADGKHTFCEQFSYCLLVDYFLNLYTFIYTGAMGKNLLKLDV